MKGIIVALNRFVRFVSTSEVAVSQGSQRAATIAAMSSVLTAEKQPTETPPSCLVKSPHGAEDFKESPEVKETEADSAVGIDWVESKPKPEQEQEDNSECGQTIFSYERVKAKSINPVTGIYFKRKEAYLSDEEFETVLGTTKEAFYNLPRWKKDMFKRKVDLF